MAWMEVTLHPMKEWDEEGLANWAVALGAFFMEKGIPMETSLEYLPGYQIIKLDQGEKTGELLISSSERLLVLMGLSFKTYSDWDILNVLSQFARKIGAMALRTRINNIAEKEFWQRRGAIEIPDPVPLQEDIQKRLVEIEPLYKQSLLVRYRGKPALCLEPIFCNGRPEGVVSLAARRLERLLGDGSPIGFASRISAYSPWEFTKVQWDDLLAYSRLEAYEILERLVLESLPIHNKYLT